jgi:hypothetical protein
MTSPTKGAAGFNGMPASGDQMGDQTALNPFNTQASRANYDSALDPNIVCRFSVAVKEKS